MARKLINEPYNVVVEGLDGLVASVPHLGYLDGFPDIKVILNRNFKNDQVAVISGGGSGHEPAHAGYVGSGMLAAAICGDVFASPPTEAVLAALRAVSGPAGALLIVKNYTGDRLNFGMAAEAAKAEGIPVEMVIVADDVALDDTGSTGPRGIAGTVFVHKIAGAAAADGLSLTQVKHVAEAAASSIASMGVATGICTVPGAPPSSRLDAGMMELGLGIHGEPGASTVASEPAHIVVRLLLDRITGASHGLHVKPGDRVALLVNSLGATPAMELYIIASEALKYLKSLQVRTERLYVGYFMTALDMCGASLSLMRLDDASLARLDAPCRAPAWPAEPPTVEPLSKAVPVPTGPSDAQGPLQRPAQLDPAGQILEAAIVAACQVIEKIAYQLDELDSRVGDGDCGATLLIGAKAVLKDIQSYPLNNAAATLRALGQSLHGMGGTSGAIYNIGLTAASGFLQGPGSGKEVMELRDWARALDAAIAAIQKYGGARPGDRTLLDALVPAAEALSVAVADGDPASDAARAAAVAAEAGAEATAQLKARAGRSSYVPSHVTHGSPDPGAKAVAAWLSAISNVLAR